MKDHHKSAWLRTLRSALIAVLCSSLTVILLALLVGRRAWSDPHGEPPVPIAWSVDAVQARVQALPTDAPVRIAVIGDVQNGLSELSRLLEAVSAHEPDLILFLGDCVNEATDARYAALRRVVRAHTQGIPVLAVPGNHDLDERGTTDTYSRWMRAQAWQLNFGSWKLLGLDDADGPLTARSVNMLRSAAQADGDQQLILVAHRPIGGPASAGSAVRRRQLAESGALARTAVTLQGHTHRSSDSVDAAGARHLHLGANCDRSKDTPRDEPVSAFILELRPCGLSMERVEVERGMCWRQEAERLLISHVYDCLRPDHAGREPRAGPSRRWRGPSELATVREAGVHHLAGVDREVAESDCGSRDTEE